MRPRGGGVAELPLHLRRDAPDLLPPAVPQLVGARARQPAIFRHGTRRRGGCGLHTIAAGRTVVRCLQLWEAVMGRGQAQKTLNLIEAAMAPGTACRRLPTSGRSYTGVDSAGRTATAPPLPPLPARVARGPSITRSSRHASAPGDGSGNRSGPKWRSSAVLPRPSFKWLLPRKSG